MTIAAKNGYTYTIDSNYDLDDNYAYGSLNVIAPDGIDYHYDLYGYESATYNEYYKGLTLAIAAAAGIINPAYDDEDINDGLINDVYDLHDDISNDLIDALKEATSYYEDAEDERDLRTAIEDADIDSYDAFVEYCPRGFANEVTLYGIRGDDERAEAQQLINKKEGDTNGYAAWVDKSDVEDMLRHGIKNAQELKRGHGIDNPPCGVREITPW